MDEIRLLYVENVISRKRRHKQQHLTFFMRVKDLGYHKQVDVLWAGEDGEWRELPASFHSKLGDGAEYWQAQIALHDSHDRSLPGNVQFGLRYRAAGGEYWDNQHGHNYHSQADTGILLAVGQAVQNVAFASRLPNGQKYVPVTVAVNRAFKAETVTVHWTADNWRHSRVARCRYRRNYWDKIQLSNARNPNHYGVEVWQTWLRVGQAFKIQYSVCAESGGQTVCDDNFGNNYVLSRKPLSVLVLNLHCYQESDQDFKFSQIAKAINEQEADVVCLQEVAEFWNNGEGDWNSNAARIINEQLARPYYLHTDWSHLGFDRYREGVAILSRYPMHNHDARYVSDSHGAYDINSRKVVMATIEAPYIGAVNVFSAHLSWWEGGFAGQFWRLHEWAASKQHAGLVATLLCGDFNIAAGSDAYRMVLADYGYDDLYLAAQGVYQPEQNFRLDDPYWRQQLSLDYRIDYIFMGKGGGLQAVTANTLFTDRDYGRVSDHNGYLFVFEPK